MIVEKNKGKMILTVLLFMLACIWIIPIFFSLVNLFKSRIEYNLGTFWDFPKENNFMDNFAQLKSGLPVFSSMLNSLLYSLIGAFASLIIGIMAGYGLSHLNIKHKLFWFLFIYSGTIFPFQLYLIPIYKIFLATHLYDTRLGIMLVYIAICIPFVMFVMRNNFSSIDREICESAKIEGATDLQVLVHLFVPMTQSAIAVIFLTQFSWCWNDLLFSLTLLKSSGKQAIMPLISLLDKGNAPTVFMVCVVASIPTMAMFTLLQKSTEKGFVYTTK